MGLFGKQSVDSPPVQAEPAPQSQSPAPSGGINLTKGSRVTLDKHKSETIKVVNGWAAVGKDYDLKALVRYHDGRTVYVGAANRDEVLRTLDGAVTHSGDAKKAGEQETITITYHPDIASIAVSSYSALENGAGSFKEYGVYVRIENGSQVISIAAADASADSTSYTLCFGEVLFGIDGRFTVVNHELYSAPDSENRVGYEGDRVVMDIGPRGQTK